MHTARNTKTYGQLAHMLEENIGLDQNQITFFVDPGTIMQESRFLTDPIAVFGSDQEKVSCSVA